MTLGKGLLLKLVQVDLTGRGEYNLAIMNVNSGLAPIVVLHTLGCKLNQAETEFLAHQLAEAGYLISSGKKADIFVLNTCTVTHIADRKARQWLRLVRRTNPKALIIATGCYVERAPEEVMRVGGIDWVVGNSDKGQLLKLIQRQVPVKSGIKDDRLPWSWGRVRTLVKIQDGCNDFCTYCVVPRVRGREYSLPPEEIIREIKKRELAGYQEVVLTGTKVGCYRYNGIGLADLIKKILKETKISRIRLSSLQPQEISPELLSLWQDRRLCPHFHLALQSGNDQVLKRMGRRYSVASYLEAVALLRKMIPDVAITTDVMVGFPGETEAEFEDTYRLCQELGFARIHVFPYSPRPGTPAASMVPVTEITKRMRVEKMLKLASLSAKRFKEQFLGQDLEVLWEKEVVPGIYSGLTSNYLRVFIRSNEPLTNKLLPVRITDGVWGEEAIGTSESCF